MEETDPETRYLERVRRRMKTKRNKEGKNGREGVEEEEEDGSDGYHFSNSGNVNAKWFQLIVLLSRFACYLRFSSGLGSGRFVK
ncbi:hypothetical protein V6N12_053289 [Hibiscus sabdariffa]|uniref:Uncharacterized protein n=1 Tax=Hibiscus sabdariffa TaxID=183260 RepID=A0ABR2D751_9ROSI